MQSPLASTVPPTPMTPTAAYAAVKGLVQSGLEGTIAPADMLNVLSAHRESVNTADGKAKFMYSIVGKKACLLYCSRLRFNDQSSRTRA